MAGETLKGWRAKRGWSQSKLAKESGLHTTTISLLESGRLKPYRVQAQKLAVAFGVTAEEVTALLGGIQASGRSS
jgi:transcriptional regulator with XRE-family HTH domain